MNEEEQFIRSVRKTGTSLGINIPKEIIDLMELENGDIVKVSIKKIKKGVKDQYKNTTKHGK